MLFRSCEGDDDAAGEGEKAVGALRGVVTLEREADLHDAPAEQDDADRADEPEHKRAQIVDDRKRIARCEGGNGEAAEKRGRQNERCKMSVIAVATRIFADG